MKRGPPRSSDRLGGRRTKTVEEMRENKISKKKKKLRGCRERHHGLPTKEGPRAKQINKRGKGVKSGGVPRGNRKKKLGEYRRLRTCKL